MRAPRLLILPTVLGTRRSGSAEIAQRQGRLTILPLEVTDPRAVKQAVAAAFGLGRVDVVVNNAGYGLLGSVEEATEEQVSHLFDVNFHGPRRVIQARRLRRSGRLEDIQTRMEYSPAFKKNFATAYLAEEYERLDEEAADAHAAAGTDARAVGRPGRSSPIWAGFVSGRGSAPGPGRDPPRGPGAARRRVWRRWEKGAPGRPCPPAPKPTESTESEAGMGRPPRAGAPGFPGQTGGAGGPNGGGFRYTKHVLAGDTAVLDRAAEVLGAIRRTKTEAKRSMRWPVATVNVTGDPDQLAAVRAAAADLADAGGLAGGVETLTTGAGAWAVQVVLGEQSAPGS